MLAELGQVSGLWKFVLSVKDDFHQWIRHRAQDGKRVSFSYDKCCGQMALCDQFSTLFLWIIRDNRLLLLKPFVH